MIRSLRRLAVLLLHAPLGTYWLLMLVILGVGLIGYLRGSASATEGIRALVTMALVVQILARVKGVPAWPWQYDLDAPGREVSREPSPER